MEWYERIKDLRMAHKMTQQQLAEAAGYTDRSSIAKIERGQVDISQSKLETFSRIFGVSPSYLMGPTEEDMLKIEDRLYQLSQDEETILIEYNKLDGPRKELLIRYLAILNGDPDDK